MRIIFIHGLGETESCFSKIAPKISGEHLYISLWEALGSDRRRNLNVIGFCRELIDRYDIEKEDVIIGHSTGARLAHYIKHLNGNRIIQIAGWTKDGKTRFPIKSKRLIYFFARSGLLFTQPALRYTLAKYKRREESKPYYIEAMQNLKAGNRNCAVNQFKLALSAVNEEVLTAPDVRIHARRDNVVGYPDEPFYEVPGDHFSLLTHPDEVLEGIRTVLS